MSLEEHENSLLDELFDHVDSVVTIFTEGSRCHGFTGLLTNVNCDVVKMITRDGCFGDFDRGCFGGGFRRFGTVTLIPVREITAVTFCNTTF